VFHPLLLEAACDQGGAVDFGHPFLSPLSPPADPGRLWSPA
jgi:hypothetical protein